MKKVLFGLLLLGVSVFSESLRIVQTTEEIPELGPVQRLIVQTSAGIFSLIPPRGWASAVDPEHETITFQFEHETAVLSAHFSTNAPPKSAEQIKEWIDDKWPNGRIVEESAAYTRDGQGRMIECAYSSAAKTDYRTRIAFIPCGRGGHVEFVLSAPEDWPPRLHHSWTTLLNSFQAEQASAKRLFQAPR